MNKQELGLFGEEKAVQYLESIGYQILERNWKVRVGEIDIISEYEGELIFVEVKTRTSDRFGGPEEAITRTKQSRIIRASAEFLHQKELGDKDWRVDLIAITCTSNLKLVELEHYENVIVGPLEDFL